MTTVDVPTADLLGFDLLCEAAAKNENFSAILTNTKPSSLSPTEDLPKICGDDIALCYEPLALCVGDALEGFIVAGSDWSAFCFRASATDDLLNDIDEQLDKVYSNSSNDILSITNSALSSMVGLGFPCVARYAENNKWCRAKIQDVEYAHVYFVDIGRRQLCNSDNVKPLLKADLAGICPPLAMNCTLSSDSRNLLLPSFVSGPNNKIQVTLQSKCEPFEVVVKLITQQSLIPGRPPLVARQQQRPANQWFNRSRGHGRSTWSALPPNNDADKKAFFKLDEDGDVKSKHSVPKFVTANDGKSLLMNVSGRVIQIYATCGQIKPDRPYGSYILDFNSQQSSLDNGSWDADDLCRIIKVGDCFMCNAHYERPASATKNFDDDDISKCKSSVSDLNGSYIVTTMEFILNKNVLIKHATVSLANDKGAQLYIRSSNTYVYAPLSSFPKSILPTFSKHIQIGRSVLVRAVSYKNQKNADLSFEWVAEAVELLGGVEENQGWMYFVRDNYSVVITDGGVGFGYVYVDNNFVDASGVAKEDWSGSRVSYLACRDVPDQSRQASSIRMRGLRVAIDPKHEKGRSRYPGVYRPPPLILGEQDLSPSFFKKETDDDDELCNQFYVPEEFVKEIGIMGKDVIGIGSLRASPIFQRSVSESAQNALNEIGEIATNSFCPSADSFETIQEESNVELFVDYGNSALNVAGFPVYSIANSGRNNENLLDLWENENKILEHPCFENKCSNVPSASKFTSTSMPNGSVQQHSRDVSTQVELSMQLEEEVRRLKSDPQKLAIVLAAFLKAPPATKDFFLNLYKKSESS